MNIGDQAVEDEKVHSLQEKAGTSVVSRRVVSSEHGPPAPQVSQPLG